MSAIGFEKKRGRKEVLWGIQIAYHAGDIRLGDLNATGQLLNRKCNDADLTLFFGLDWNRDSSYFVRYKVCLWTVKGCKGKKELNRDTGYGNPRRDRTRSHPINLDIAIDGTGTCSWLFCQFQYLMYFNRSLSSKKNLIRSLFVIVISSTWQTVFIFYAAWQVLLPALHRQ